MVMQTGAHHGLRGRLKRRRPFEPDPGNAGAGRSMGREADNRYDAIFVGGGVIGLACAWRAAQRGARVCVLERERPAAGASGVAAGMLAPVGEASWGEEELLELNLESLRRWPDFAESLEEESGLETEFAQKGALHVALDRDEAEELRRRHELHRTLGLESEWLPGRSCRELEAGLATAVRGGTHVPGEASVDPRRVVAALLSALEHRGAEVLSGAEVLEASRRDGAWRVRTSDGSSFTGEKLVIAAGPWSGRMDWLPEVPPVRPVKGGILTLMGSGGGRVCEGGAAGGGG